MNIKPNQIEKPSYLEQIADEDLCKSIAFAAGRLADIAGVLVGVSLNYKEGSYCHLDQLSSILPKLKSAVIEYNDLIIKHASANSKFI